MLHLRNEKFIQVFERLFILQMLGDAFDACALFTLGASMVNRFGIIAKLSAAYPISLILSKTLLLPILCMFCCFSL